MPDATLLEPAHRLIDAWEALKETRARDVALFRWTSLSGLIAAREANAQAKYSRLESLWAQYEEGMPAWLLPDPSRENWAAFRPLRLSREEDWADWLGHLLQMCPDGAFHRDLFGEDLGDRVQAHREVPVNWDGLMPRNGARKCAPGDYRVDLILTSDVGAVHVEVKVGDPHLRKTWPTGLAIRHGEHPVELPNGIQADYLLVLPWQRRGQYEPIKERLNSTFGIEIVCITWRQVGLSLRRILQTMHERQSWALLARVFLGAIEQTLLHHPYRDPANGNEFVAGDAPGATRYFEEILQ